MTIKTTINRTDSDDIPVRILIDCQDHESPRCAEYAICNDLYWNNAGTAVTFDLGDKIELTDAEQKQFEQEASDKLADEKLRSVETEYVPEVERGF